jgi:hypothetical protein
MDGRAESLNVGVACAVVCFEALRQRRAAAVPRHRSISRDGGTETPSRVTDDGDWRQHRQRGLDIDGSSSGRRGGHRGRPVDRRPGQVETELLGKRSALTRAHRALGSLDPEARKEAGRQLHEARPSSRRSLAARRAELAGVRAAEALLADRLDLTEVIPDQVRSPLAGATSTWSPRPGTSSRTSSWAWASPWPRAPRRRRTGTTSRRSTCRRPIRPGACTTPCTSTSASPRRCCCAPTPRRCRST